MTAYQITSIMEGVVQRGTAAGVGFQKEFGKPIAGKTGTTSDYRDAWFIGFTPGLVCGVYLGYDKPRSLGNEATGGDLAVPVFTEFMQDALKGKPPTPFNMPAGMSQVWIDPKTGVQADAGGGAIAEAFKPGTGPNLATSVIGVADNAYNSDGTDTGTDSGFGDNGGGDNAVRRPPADVFGRPRGDNGVPGNSAGFLFGNGGLF